MSETIRISQPFTLSDVQRHNRQAHPDRDITLPPESTLGHTFYEIENLNWNQLGTTMRTEFSGLEWGRGANDVDLDRNGIEGVVVWVEVPPSNE
jgi:hypothetical protein